MLFGGPREFCGIQGSPLLHEEEHFEFLPPAEHGSRLRFQVFCNGLPIAHARLEKVEKHLVSHLRVVNLFDARHRPTYTLKMIQVAQTYRNRGVGTLLLKEILHYCRHHQVFRLTGEIKGDLRNLSTWYRRNGFTIIGENWLEIQLG